MKNRNRISYPFGMFIWVVKTTTAAIIPSKLNSVIIIGPHNFMNRSLYKRIESQISNEN